MLPSIEFSDLYHAPLSLGKPKLNNMGTNVMKLAINRRLLLPPDERPRLSRLPMWVGGFAMFTLGTAMSFGAFKFAAQSLLSGLGSVQFLSQVFFSRFILHEKIERYAYAGVGLIITGCVFIVIFGAHGTKNYRPEELAALYGRSEYVCYLLGAGFLACFVSLAYTSMKQRIMRDRGIGRFDIAKSTIRERQILAVFFSIKSALFGTQAVVLAKSLSMLLIQALHPNPAYSNPLLSYQTYFILMGFIAAATYWVTRLNHGLRLFEAVYLIPMMQICWILFSTIAGGIYYEEFIGFGKKEYGAYAVGFICVLVGVAMLCPRDDANAKSLNAADVIYEIVSEENPLVSPQHPKFQPFNEEDEEEAGGRQYRVVRTEESDEDQKQFSLEDDSTPTEQQKLRNDESTTEAEISPVRSDRVEISSDAMV
ncbi:putative magnesium transporter NIPA8 [Gracilariopsis chorda]|uniref:Putative magnesium transporter NIPA8 n=1 Tax=Gracilariopsis chorda TaxID=448386 RepID=A0A2V3J133_9FLOR|nr:putative magnesium transporter NIPA8 [Gracilariopsis chorda]|eukprot:PXF48069.1 putative magnesium transporter NIPA8 [Gracilariopsis chorda]